MNQIKLESVLLMGISVMAFISCSKENVGEVKSISKSFEGHELEEIEYPAVKTSYAEEVLNVESGKFNVVVDNAQLTATFERLFTNGEDFMWSFPGASPATSINANPGVIIYLSAGDYDITLDVTIEGVDYSHTETVKFE